MKDKKETAPEVPVQEQLKKYRETNVKGNDFEKIITMLMELFKPINFNDDFSIKVNYDSKTKKVCVEYFRVEL